MHVCICMCMCMCMCVCVYVYIYIYIYIRTYTHIHKHTFGLISRQNLAYSSLTKDSLQFLSQMMSFLFQSDKGFFTIPLSNNIFTMASYLGTI